MTLKLWTMALGTSLTILLLPADVFAGRGGGRGGGGMQRGGGGGGGMQRGGGGGGFGGAGGGGGMQRGGGGGGMRRGGGGGGFGGNTGGMNRGGAGGGFGGNTGGMNRGGAGGGFGGAGGGFGGGGGAAGFGGGSTHSPSFSQPRNTAGPGNQNARNPYANNSNNAAAAGAGYANRNQPGNLPNNGAAAAGAGYSNRNQQGNLPNNGAAAAGAGYSNRNQQGNLPNNGAAAAGAGFANRNQPGSLPNNGAAAAGAGYANRNQQGNLSNAGAAAAGADYANRNQNPYSNAGAAAAGAAYSNRNQYDQYHPGLAAGTWNNHYGVSAVNGYGGVGAWGVGSAAYGYGYAAYANPYTAVMPVGAINTQVQPAPAAYDYSQPLNTDATPPQPPADNAGPSPIDQARQTFSTGDYPTALKLTQQGIQQLPNDVTLHEFEGLVLFAMGKYDQAAAPLYAVLSVGPGWDWTTLISNYSDASTYTQQLRALEAYVKANPKSASALFVLAYQYITQGNGQAAIPLLKTIVALEPGDTVSAQLLAKMQPSASETPAAPPQPEAFDPSKLAGTWKAQNPNAAITLNINDGGKFTWVAAPPGKPEMTINGTTSVDNGVLTLASADANAGNMAGNVVWKDDTHFNFRAVGAPASDPGLNFGR